MLVTGIFPWEVRISMKFIALVPTVAAVFVRWKRKICFHRKYYRKRRCSRVWNEMNNDLDGWNCTSKTASKRSGVHGPKKCRKSSWRIVISNYRFWKTLCVLSPKRRSWKKRFVLFHLGKKVSVLPNQKNCHHYFAKNAFGCPETTLRICIVCCRLVVTYHCHYM